MIELVLLILVYLPVSLLVLYTIGIQYNRFLILRPLIVFLFLGLIVDILANYSTFTIYLWEKPGKFSIYLNRPEYTLSDRLERLVLNTGWRANIARVISKYLNFVAPFKHIHNMI